MQAVGSF